MDENKRSILDWIDRNREEIVSDYVRLVRIPSRTGDEQLAQQFMAKQFRDLDMEVDVWEPDVRELFERYPEVAQYPTRWEKEYDLAIPFPDICTYDQWMNSGLADVLNYRNRPNVVGTLKGAGGGKSLIMNGHIDTVTCGDESEWEHDPLAGEMVGDVIYARGACDMKGGVMAMTKAVKALRESGVKLRGDVILESAVNEEHAGNGSLACVARGYRADGAICTDTTGVRRMCTASGGGVYWDIEIEGRAVHTGARWNDDGSMNGVSAIEKAGPIICALRAQEKLANKEETVLSLGIGVITGGGHQTSTAASCKLSGVVYFGPKAGTGPAGIQRIKDMLRSAIDEVAAGDEWLSAHKPKLSFLHYDDAYIYPADKCDIDKCVAQACLDVTGAPIEVSAESACDARHIGNQGGTPCIVYGPGDIAYCHMVNEYMDVNDVVEATKILALAAYDFCK